MLKRLNFKNKHKEEETRHAFVKVTRRNINIENESKVHGLSRKKTKTKNLVNWKRDFFKCTKYTTEMYTNILKSSLKAWKYNDRVPHITK